MFFPQGQTESKKRSRSVETKGTQMSFGFKKKLPVQKKNVLASGTKSKDKNDLTANNANKVDNACCVGDNNGNSLETFDSISDKSTGRTTPKLIPPKKESTGTPYRSTRFGFRLNRPSSTGITSQNNSNCDNVINNNVTENKLNGKFR